MPQGGLPFNPKTAYVVIRGAVNAGRQEVAEMYAARMMVSLFDFSMCPTSIQG